MKQINNKYNNKNIKKITNEKSEKDYLKEIDNLYKKDVKKNRDCSRDSKDI